MSLIPCWTPEERRRRRLVAFARLLASYLARDDATRRSIDAIAVELDAPVTRPLPADRDALIDTLDDLLAGVPPGPRIPG